MMRDEDVEELHRIWELKEKGAISDDEYARLKAKILASEPESTPVEDKASTSPPLSENPVPSQPAKAGSKNCLTVIAVMFGLLVILAIAAPPPKDSESNSTKAEVANLISDNTEASPKPTPTTDSSIKNTSDETEPATEESDGTTLTFSQMNAARSARQYLAMTGFSRDGLIQQLSSSAGDGYSVSDATAAVDSLDVDWNENAVRSARQYLDMTGFSCEGLIEQLSSSAGEKYTREQATYGARQAGAC